MIGSCTYLCFSRAEHKDLNVILITIDSLRPDHLGCYGYKRNTSPNIDQLAQTGAIFTQAIAQGPYTHASVPSFITSSYPYQHPVYLKERTAYIDFRTETLAEILKKEGYRTVLFTDQRYIDRIFGIRRGFDNYFNFKTDNPEKITESALKWILKNKDNKIFLWLYYRGVHSPYREPLFYAEIFHKDGLDGVDKNIPISDSNIQTRFQIPKNVAEKQITSLNYYLAKYDGMIHLIDDQIGLLMDGLKKLNLDQHTLIVLLADHGEALGEHDYYFTHLGNLGDELLRAPLIIRNPDWMISSKTTINCQVRLIDMLPTVLDSLHIRKDSNVQGASLVPEVLGAKPDCKGDSFSNTSDTFVIRTDIWKLIYTDPEKLTSFSQSTVEVSKLLKGKYELYNLNRDPEELSNLDLINRERDIFLRLKQRLDKYVIKARQETVENSRKIRNYYKDSVTDPLSENIKEEIRNLGYMN